MKKQKPLYEIHTEISRYLRMETEMESVNREAAAEKTFEKVKELVKGVRSEFGRPVWAKERPRWGK